MQPGLWKKNGRRELICGLLLAFLAIIFLSWSVTPSGTSLQAFAGSVVSQEQEGYAVSEEYLRASVDSLALALGGALHAVSADYDKKIMISNALDSISFGGKSIHYMAWEGPVVVHAPLAPDVNAMDFSSATDVYGNGFMEDLIRQSMTGGFLTLHLSGKGAVAEKQIVYSRVIPESSWFLAAFLTEAKESPGQDPSDVFQFGLILLGMSLAGLSLLVAQRGVTLRRRYRRQILGTG